MADRNFSIACRTLRMPDEIDDQDDINATLFPPIAAWLDFEQTATAVLADAQARTPTISLAAQNLVDIADSLCSALIAGGVAAHLDREAIGRYEVGIASAHVLNPYTRRVAYLQLLQAFRDQPDAVKQALIRLYDELAAAPFSPEVV